MFTLLDVNIQFCEDILRVPSIFFQFESMCIYIDIETIKLIIRIDYTMADIPCRLIDEINNEIEQLIAMYIKIMQSFCFEGRNQSPSTGHCCP